MGKSENEEIEWAYGVLYDDLDACGCGFFEERLKLLRDVLRACPLYNGGWSERDTVLGEWFLCLLTAADLIEHGSAIGGSWLTEKGARFLNVLNDEKAWEFLLKT